MSFHQPELTQTKKREVIKAIKRHAEGGLDSADMEYISRTQHVPIKLLYGMVDAAGLKVKEKLEIPAAPAPKPVEKRGKARTTEAVRRAIQEGRIYKRLYQPEDGEAEDDDAMVFTTVRQLRREREMLMAWLDDARDGLA